MFLCEPADVEWFEFAGEGFGGDVEEGCAWAAAEIFVTATDEEVGVHGGDVDGEDADGVVGVDEESSACFVALCCEVVEVGDDLAGCEEDLRDDDQVDAVADFMNELGEVDFAFGVLVGDGGEADSAYGGVLLEDDVD